MLTNTFNINKVLIDTFNTKQNKQGVNNVVVTPSNDASKELFINPRAVDMGNDQSAKTSDTKVCTQGVCTTTWKPNRNAKQ